ncbi:type VII secretion target [Glycomyces niveus]|uniref:PE domain-containing protein n=1 Tax=Glycomyces niveus TaxID=2820287 RepID=A0ABS3U3W1_9ACTN|nr:type VII secretion target [Glycomyces sp. NEAU-S30]MBO3733461.1 PE domain-containing protein [Glycomyces sp. NEAU-S30]
MSSGIQVDPEELRTHAGHIDSLIARFETVKAASAQITAAPDAFGPLCEWMAGILEDKHQMVEPLFDKGKSNLGTHVEALRTCADLYEESDASAGGDFDKLGGEI